MGGKLNTLYNVHTDNVVLQKAASSRFQIKMFNSK